MSAAELEAHAERAEREDRDGFQQDLLRILGSHRPDPAVPQPPEPASAPVTAPVARDQQAGARSTESLPQAASHAVFDRLGEQLSQARTYDLGPVSLAQRLAELDRVIDAEDARSGRRAQRADVVRALSAHDDVLDVAGITAPASARPVSSATPSPGTAAATRSSSPAPPGADATRGRAQPRPLQRIVHDVDLVPAVDGLSCWAAAAASLIAWRDAVTPTAEAVAGGAGHWSPYADGRTARRPEEMQAWGLTFTTVAADDAGALLAALESHGPLWVTAVPPGPHAVVVTGATGDGTPVGTALTLLDPCTRDRGTTHDPAGPVPWDALHTVVGGVPGTPLTVAHLTAP